MDKLAYCKTIEPSFKLQLDAAEQRLTHLERLLKQAVKFNDTQGRQMLYTRIAAEKDKIELIRLLWANVAAVLNPANETLKD